MESAEKIDRQLLVLCTVFVNPQSHRGIGHDYRFVSSEIYSNISRNVLITSYVNISCFSKSGIAKRCCVNN